MTETQMEILQITLIFSAILLPTIGFLVYLVKQYEES